MTDEIRIRGCGHGECTTAGTPCKYETPAERRETEANRVRWHAADLDRCEHGRHSIDHCFDCPGGQSDGNRYLDRPDCWPVTRRTVEGRTEVRIGTMVRGEPIWVVVRDMPRVNENKEVEPVSEQPIGDGKLPCSECGHRVRPGRHTTAECARFQQDDATENKGQIDGGN